MARAMRLSISMSFPARSWKNLVAALLRMAGLNTFFCRRKGSHCCPLKLLEAKRVLEVVFSTSSMIALRSTLTRQKRDHHYSRRGCLISRNPSRCSTRRIGRSYLQMALTGIIAHVALTPSLSTTEDLGTTFSTGAQPARLSTQKLQL